MLSITFDCGILPSGSPKTESVLKSTALLREKSTEIKKLFFFFNFKSLFNDIFNWYIYKVGESIKQWNLFDALNGDDFVLGACPDVITRAVVPIVVRIEEGWWKWWKEKFDDRLSLTDAFRGKFTACFWLRQPWESIGCAFKRLRRL